MSKPGEFVELHETAKATLHGIRAEDNNTPSEEYAAALYVCGHAPDDGHELLLALGLLDPGFRWVRPNYHNRKRVKQ